MPESLYERFAPTLTSLLNCSQSELIVALSGGVDSVVLLHLANRFALEHGLMVKAVHVDHGLSRNAQSWASFCEAFCQQLGVICYIERATVVPKPRVSLEESAREARYALLTQHCGKNSVLLTGHHSDDQLETFFLRLKRGSGPKGLAAMRSFRSFADGGLLRPLLSFSRDELQTYAQENALNWIEDESNVDERFDRNFLRSSITPLLKKRWPQFSKAVQRSAELCSESDLLAQEIAAEDLARLSLNPQYFALPVAPLEKMSLPRRNNLLRYWIAQQSDLPPSREQLSQLWQNVAQSREDAQAQLNWGRAEFRRYRGELYLLQGGIKSLSDQELDANQLRSGSQAIAYSDNGIVELTHQCSGERLRLPNENERVLLRFDGSGQLCHPVNRFGSRKFKKLMQELGIPPWQRQQIPLIYYDEQLVAAVGLWLDKRYLQTGEQLTGISLTVSRKTV